MSTLMRPRSTFSSKTLASECQYASIGVLLDFVGTSPLHGSSRTRHRASTRTLSCCWKSLALPGIHLHHDGHRDLLGLFEELAAKNTIIYTTHLATMLDSASPERIRIVEVHEHHARV